jgi:MFS transporter, DHA1 family, inner membrane transport protein
VADTIADTASRLPLDRRTWPLALGAFAIGTDAFVVAGLLPEMARDLGVGLDAAGQVVTAYSLTYGLGSPILAALAGRWRRDRMVLWVLVFFALSNAACALAPDYRLLILARVAAGLAGALYSPAAYVIAAELAPVTQRGAALARVALGLTGSTVLGVPIGVYLGEALGWHATFWLVALLSALAWVALAAGRLPRGLPDGLSLAARLAPLARGRVLLTILPQLLWSTASLMVYTYIAALLAVRGHDASLIPFLLLIYGIGGLLGGQLGGRMSDRFGPARPVLLFLCVAILNQMLLGLAADWRGVAACGLFGWGMVAWGMWAPQQSRLMATEPRHPAVLLALANSVVYLSAAMGAGLGALLLPWVGLIRLPFVAVVLYVAAFVAFIVAGRRLARDAVQANPPGSFAGQ